MFFNINNISKRIEEAVLKWLDSKYVRGDKKLSVSELQDVIQSIFLIDRKEAKKYIIKWVAVD